MPDSADVLIKGGTVVDGTGAKGFAADVAVVDGRIRIIREAASRPTSVGTSIDAAGKVVCPGFIDLHSHSGLWILAEPRHEPKVRQGVKKSCVEVEFLDKAGHTRCVATFPVTNVLVLNPERTPVG